MISKLFPAVLTTALCSTAIGASAQDVGDVSASLGLSTFGANYEAMYQIRPNLRLRGAVMGGLDYSGTETEDGTTFDVDAELSAFAALVDYYPTNSGWRVSGGLLVNGSNINSSAVGSPSNPIEIDGVNYTSGTLDLDAEFENTVAPMITTGYDYRFKDNWTLSGEVGAVYTGGIDLTAKGSSATLQSAIDSSTDYSDARDDASDITFYPYLSVTVGYRF